MKSLLNLSIGLMAILVSHIASAKTQFEVSIKTPSSCEQIMISDVYSEYEKVVIVAKVLYPKGDYECMTMIGQSSDSVSLDIAKPKTIERVIVGKGWCWRNPSEKNGYTYIKSEAQLQALIKDKTRVFTKAVPEKQNFKGVEADKHCQTDKAWDEDNH